MLSMWHTITFIQSENTRTKRKKKTITLIESRTLLHSTNTNYTAWELNSRRRSMIFCFSRIKYLMMYWIFTLLKNLLFGDMVLVIDFFFFFIQNDQYTKWSLILLSLFGSSIAPESLAEIQYSELRTIEHSLHYNTCNLKLNQLNDSKICANKTKLTQNFYWSQIAAV